MVQPVDVAIIGAGPAGAWAARDLALRGARVAIFDGSHPREKPCGGGVTGRALELIASALNAAALPAVVVERARFAERPGSPTVDVALAHAGLTSASMLIVTDRQAFDAALLHSAVAAGADHVPSRVEDVGVAPHGVRLRAAGRWFEAARVIGADGANSLLRRRVHRPFARRELSIAAGFYVDERTSTAIDIAFTSDPAGYFWSFPRQNHLAVGACAQGDATTADAMRGVSERWLAHAGLAAAARRRYSWPIPSLPPDALRQPVAGDRWLLAGDAAGFVDPITREGIYFALKSGALAASALAADAGTAAHYARAVEEGIVPELEHAARLKAGFYRPRFITLAMRGLAESDRIRQVMADLVAGRQPYRTLRRRLIATREIGLAMNLVLSSATRFRTSG